MRRPLLLFLAATLLVSLGLNVETGQSLAQEKTVTIGMMGSWTGPLGPMGVVSRKGAYLAQQHINETGFTVGGEKYKIEFYDWDVRTDPKVAVAGVTKMMDEKDIKVIVGPMYSAATIAVQPITQPRGVIHIVYSSAVDVLREGITHTFRCVGDARQRSVMLNQYYYGNMGVRSIAFIVENMATALSMYNTNAPAFEERGGKVVGKEIFETGTTDFFTSLVKLKSKNPDALFLASNPESSGLIVKQTREIGWNVQTIGEGNSPTGPAFFEIAGDAVEGHIDLTSIDDLDPGEGVSKLVAFDREQRARYYKEFPEKYQTPAELSVGRLYYDMVHLAVEAMVRAGTVADTVKIREALLTMDYPGVYSRWKFLPNGQCIFAGAIAVYHSGSKWDTLAICQPLDALGKDWETTELVPAPKIADIRAKRRY